MDDIDPDRNGAMLDRITVGVLVLVLVIPAALALTGHSGAPDANREPVEPPDPRALIQLEPEELRQGTAWVEQENPLRRAAVRADALLDTRVFHDSPSDRVALGADDWLFLSQAVDQGCLDDKGARRIREQLELVRDVIRASGREAVLAIAPDKIAMQPEHHGGLASRARCAVANAELLSAEIESGDGIIDLWEALRDVEQPVDELYFRQDSHWNGLGSAVFVDRVTAQLAPELREPVRVEPGGEAVVDLSELIGLPRTEPDPEVVFGPPDSVVAIDEGDGITMRTEAMSDPPPVPGETWFLHDSFGLRTRVQLRPLFERLVTHRLDWGEPALPLPGDLSEADRIIALIVQRRAVTGLLRRGELAPRIAATLADDLGAVTHPGPVPAFGADFVDVAVEVEDGTEVNLVDAAGTVIDTAAAGSGSATFDTRGRDGAKVTGPRGAPVETGSWRYIAVERG